VYITITTQLLAKTKETLNDYSTSSIHKCDYVAKQSRLLFSSALPADKLSSVTSSPLDRELDIMYVNCMCLLVTSAQLETQRTLTYSHQICYCCEVNRQQTRTINSYRTKIQKNAKVHRNGDARRQLKAIRHHLATPFSARHDRQFHLKRSHRPGHHGLSNLGSPKQHLQMAILLPELRSDHTAFIRTYAEQRRHLPLLYLRLPRP
jgi:hypothetical protein